MPKRKADPAGPAAASRSKPPAPAPSSPTSIGSPSSSSVSDTVFDRQRLDFLTRRMDLEVKSGAIGKAECHLRATGPGGMFGDEPDHFEYSTDGSAEGTQVYRMASMTKAVTSVAALQLVELGTIMLTEPITTWIPELADMEVFDADGNLTKNATPITIKHLLNHTSGLSYRFNTLST